MLGTERVSADELLLGLFGKLRTINFSHNHFFNTFVVFWWFVM